MQLNSWGVEGKWDSCPGQQPAESTPAHVRTGPFPKPRDLSHLLSACWSTEFGWAFCHQPAQAEEKSTLNLSRSQQKINFLKAERKVTSSLLYTGHISVCHISLLHISTGVHVYKSERYWSISGCNRQVKAQNNFSIPLRPYLCLF